MGPLVSVLMSAYNEEKIIGAALAHIEKIRNSEYKNMEVLVGVNGCTDNTEKVVRRFKFVKVIKSKKLLHLHEMLAKLFEQSKGEIIVINHADLLWITNNNFHKIIDAFKDKKIGAIAWASHPDFRTVPDSANSLLWGEFFSDYLLHRYKEKRFSKKINGKSFVKSNEFPFFVNIFSRKALPHLPKHEGSVSDDVERAIKIMKGGYRILIPDKDFPYHVLNHSNISFGDLLRQKVRGGIARSDIKSKYGQYNASLFGFYLPAFFFAFRTTLAIVWGVIAYWFVSGLGAILSRLKKKEDPQKFWKTRLKR